MDENEILEEKEILEGGTLVKEETPVNEEVSLKEKEKLNRKWIGTLLFFYFVILFWIVIFKCNVAISINAEWCGRHFMMEWIPFESVVRIFQGDDTLEKIIFFINLIAFMPMGILFPYFMKNWKSVLTVFLVSLFVELFQLFIGWGGYDTTDVIMCFLGGALGVWLHKVAFKKMSNRLINRLAIFFTISTGIVSVFVVINTILNFPPIYLDKWFSPSP